MTGARHCTYSVQKAPHKSAVYTVVQKATRTPGEHCTHSVQKAPHVSIVHIACRRAPV